MKRALIIEDNEDNRALISFILEHHGYETLTAVNGLDGVASAESSLPDFILLDIQLPDIDGYEVLRRIRASRVVSATPVIAVTSHAMSGDRERLLNAGCNAYIEKPIDPSRIVASIREAIGDTR